MPEEKNSFWGEVRLHAAKSAVGALIVAAIALLLAYFGGVFEDARCTILGWLDIVGCL